MFFLCNLWVVCPPPPPPPPMFPWKLPNYTTNRPSLFFSFPFLMQNTTIIRFGRWGGGGRGWGVSCLASAFRLYPFPTAQITHPVLSTHHSDSKSPWNGSSSQPSDLPPLSFNPTVVTIPVFWKVGSVLLCSAAENWPGRVGSGRVGSVVDVVFHSSARCVSRPGARAAQKKIIKWAAATAAFSFRSCSFFSLLSRALVRLLFSSLSPLLFLFSAVCMLFPYLSSSSSVSF